MSDESNRTPMGALESRMVARLFQGIVAAIWVEAPGGLYSFAAPTSPTPEDMADAMICAQLATGLWWNGKARTAADDGGPSGLQHAFAQEIFERRLTPVLARYIKVYRSPSDGFGRDRFHAVVRTAEMVAHSAAETWFTVMGQPRVRPDEAPRSAAVPYDQAAGRVKRVPVEVARDPWFEPMRAWVKKRRTGAAYKLAGETGFSSEDVWVHALRLSGAPPWGQAEEHRRTDRILEALGYTSSVRLYAGKMQKVYVEAPEPVAEPRIDVRPVLDAGRETPPPADLCRTPTMTEAMQAHRASIVAWLRSPETAPEMRVTGVEAPLLREIVEAVRFRDASRIECGAYVVGQHVERPCILSEDWILESRKRAAVKIKEAAHVGIWVGSEREDIVTWLQAQAARCSARPEMIQKQLGEELGHAAMMILEGAHRHLAQGLWDKESEWRSADAASGLGEHENMTHRPPRSAFEERAAAARWLRGLESPRYVSSAETAAALTEDARRIERGAHREGLGLPELGATERGEIVAWLAREALSSKSQDLRRVRGIKANEICRGAHLPVQENVGEGDEPQPSPALEAVLQSVLEAFNQYTKTHPGRSAEEMVAWAAQIRFTPPHRPAGASAVSAGLRAAQKAGS